MNVSNTDGVSNQSPNVNCTTLFPDRAGFDRVENHMGDTIQEGKRVIKEFLEKHTCYELVKQSGKVVVFDTRIPINLALFALVEHEIKSCPLWNADEGVFVGMITATDFINILRHFYIRGSPMSELAEHSIASWRAIPSSITGLRYHEMVSIKPDDSLAAACGLLIKHRLHRIPVLDPIQNSVLTIVTHSGILEYLVTTFREERRLFDQPVRDLGIGTYSDIVTVPREMPLIQVLHTIIEKRISSVPVLNASGVVEGVYCVSDATELARDQSFSQLETSVGEIIRMQTQEGQLMKKLNLCSPNDTLHTIFERFAAIDAHQLICVDQFNHCVGVISLVDVFHYFFT